MAANESSVARASEVVAALFFATALVGMQALVGGTRLIYSLPVDALLGLGSLFCVFSRRNGKRAPDRICLWASAFFFGYVLLRAWFSPVPYLARTDILSVLSGLAVYLAVAFIFTSAAWRMSFVCFLIVAALVQVGIGAVQFRHGDNFMPIPFLQRFDYGWRASGFYACPNHFAGLLEVIGIFCVSLACWSRWPVWVKVLIGYAGALCYAGIALTGSRGGYLSAGFSLLVVAVLTLVALRPAGGALFWRTAAAGGLVSLMLIAAVFFGFQKSQFLSGRAQSVLDTQNIRFDLWHAAIAQWKLQPAVGTGSGTYLYYGRHFRTERVQLDPVEVHNDYLHLLAEYGAVGGAGLLFLLGAHLWCGAQAFQKLGPRRLAVSSRLPSNTLALTIGALGAVGAYLVHSFLDFNLHIPANVLLLAFVFGILANPGLGRDRQNAGTAPAPLFSRLALLALGSLLVAGAGRWLRSEYCAERSRVALRDGRHVEAMRWARAAVNLDELNPEAFFYLGESRVRRAEDLTNAAAIDSFYRAALEPFQGAVALAPNDETFLIALGRIYDALGRYLEGEAMFDRAREWDPRSIVVQKSYQAHLAQWTEGGREREVQPELNLPDKNAPLPSSSASP